VAQLCEEPEVKEECKCLRRVGVMQGLYSKEGEKNLQSRNDPSCIYLWVPFNLFGLSGWHVMWDETRLLLIVILCGFLGAMIYALRSIFWYIGHRMLVWSWLAMYIVIPIVGSMMAVVFYLVFRGGLFSPQTTVSQTSPFGFAAIAALVGMFIQQSAEKLKQIFETMMAKAEQGADSVTPSGGAKPTLDKPADPKYGADAILALTGTNLTGGKANATVAGKTTELVTTVTDAQHATATLPGTLIPNAGDKVDLTFKTAAGTSAPVTLTAT